MTTFDEIIPKLVEIFQRQEDAANIRPLLINRDLNGRVRLIVDEKWKKDDRAMTVLDKIAQEMKEALGPHAYSAKQALLFESSFEETLPREIKFSLEGIEDVYVVDRLATEGNWSSISALNTTYSRIVFFSIKGGVGRSTALAATAWALAERGKRVLVLDLDLESPGLSSSLLPEDRRPAFGIADWLVEDLVENGDAVFEDMVATSALSHNGEIFVVPAHGVKAGEYVAKLGRVWMPKVCFDGSRELWPKRLSRLLDGLEKRWSPDVTLIDSRAGIDEVASACLTDLSASTIFLFAIDGDQTWSGYRILFKHWRTSGVVREIRERLQVVGAMIPEVGTDDYYHGLRERAWDAFSEELYDEVPAGAIATEDGIWSFDESDEGAPHFPWPVRWHRGFAALRSLHGKLTGIDAEEVQTIFGPLIDGLLPIIKTERGEP
ncbi:MAG: P-loop NTPase [Proteobacteria bacterium]|nr:P-loop NTPase [Pseudomonadota bacterium]MBU4295435.1 P-loop NTPase [Pseudomonadota bacterium]